MITFSFTSEYSIICTLPSPATLEKQQQIWHIADLARQLPYINEVVVGMNNFTVYFQAEISPDTLEQQLKQLWVNHSQQQLSYPSKLIDIPVHYGGEFGEDLFDVANYHNTTPQQIIQRHTSVTYTVFMMGFQPGFPYLGGLPENLHTPRREQPRTKVPAGSVGIGGSQTGIYPFSSPGGWQIIGRTTIPLFDIKQTPPVLLKAGDQIRFIAEKIYL
ncbi:5-oxoprolinase subunit PxpB [Gallibacterium trehalosifermentans]|uniref:5-oxoprolinase subunit PxpB n=1 Tax=Gallibacterium trehalosifermentans TaxID=516935 RepID=A0ABV6H262_9PAST